jgi:hypothetical protein
MLNKMFHACTQVYNILTNNIIVYGINSKYIDCIKIWNENKLGRDKRF